MGKKLTKTEMIKRLDERNKCNDPIYLFPLSQPYINQTSLLQFKCGHGHIFTSCTDRVITSNRGCAQCKLVSDSHNKRTPWGVLLLQMAKIHNNRYTYDEASYVNSKAKIDIYCTIHGLFQQSPHDHINLKRGCAQCAAEEDVDRRKQEFINKSSKVHNDFYDYNKVDFVNQYTPVTIVCPVHGEFNQRMGDHSRGHGCRRCSGNGVSLKALQWLQHIEHTNNIVIMHAGNVGEFRLPGTRYTVDGYCRETNTVYEFHGDAYHGNPEVFNADEYCNPHDNTITAGELYNRTIAREDLIKSLGFNLVVVWEQEFDEMSIPKYEVGFNTNTITRVQHHIVPTTELNMIRLQLADPIFKGYRHHHNFTCLMCGSPFKTTLTQRLQVYKQRGVVGCALCRDSTKVIKVLTDLLDTYSISYSIRDRIVMVNGVGFLIRPLTTTPPDQLIKLQQLYAINNIDLKIIFIDELVNSDVILSKIIHIAGLSTTTSIHARKCVIRPIIDTKTKSEFLNKFHVQGSVRSKIALGAYHLDELVAVMTFTPPRVGQGNHKNDDNVDDKWELSRFVTNTDYRIPGIASKMLSYFKSHYTWSEIYSFADKRWSSGGVYIQLGFSEEHTNPPRYWYVVDGKRKHRWGYRKDALKHLPTYDVMKTERELMEEAGYHRVWDCGTIKYSIINPSVE